MKLDTKTNELLTRFYPASFIYLAYNQLTLTKDKLDTARFISSTEFVKQENEAYQENDKFKPEIIDVLDLFIEYKQLFDKRQQEAGSDKMLQTLNLCLYLHFIISNYHKLLAAKGVGYHNKSELQLLHDNSLIIAVALREELIKADLKKYFKTPTTIDCVKVLFKFIAGYDECIWGWEQYNYSLSLCWDLQTKEAPVIRYSTDDLRLINIPVPDYFKFRKTPNCDSRLNLAWRYMEAFSRGYKLSNKPLRTLDDVCRVLKQAVIDYNNSPRPGDFKSYTNEIMTYMFTITEMHYYLRLCTDIGYHSKEAVDKLILQLQGSIVAIIHELNEIHAKGGTTQLNAMRALDCLFQYRCDPIKAMNQLSLRLKL